MDKQTDMDGERKMDKWMDRYGWRERGMDGQMDGYICKKTTNFREHQGTHRKFVFFDNTVDSSPLYNNKKQVHDYLPVAQYQPNLPHRIHIVGNRNGGERIVYPIKPSKKKGRL